MIVWNYRHRIEYHRVGQGGKRTLEHTEVVDDHGWYFARAGLTSEEWRVRYTHVCADDFLERVGAKPGQWVVIVWRQPEGADQKLLCSVRIWWRCVAPRGRTDHSAQR
ncbi:hypothetical protein GTS_48960 [Gandjariella thermophila]|uniref:Uncharacterized protein n=1 Tax=Gandjariella thermophila TaxID=1931992 RepID=A0A4D4JH82_9PSEU|nr:hypothetical protein GTS_48960 [Gandjariella thermophila]